MLTRTSAERLRRGGHPIVPLVSFFRRLRGNYGPDAPDDLFYGEGLEGQNALTGRANNCGRHPSRSQEDRTPLA